MREIKEREREREQKEKRKGFTNEKRTAGFRKIVESMTAEDMAENEGKDEHHYLKQYTNAGGLLLLNLALRVVVHRRNHQFLHLRFEIGRLWGERMSSLLGEHESNR